MKGRIQYVVINLTAGWSETVGADSPKHAVQRMKEAGEFSLRGNEQIIVAPVAYARYFRV